MVNFCNRVLLTEKRIRIPIYTSVGVRTDRVVIQAGVTAVIGNQCDFLL